MSTTPPERTCACPARDAYDCVAERDHRRTGRWPEFPVEPCECVCHEAFEDWNDDGEAAS